jgi:t-SNARE complex subunit (syntaxin)
MEPGFNQQHLTKLKEDVQELNELFSMVNGMVFEQQESIGRLQEAIVDASEQHELCQIELMHATELQKNIDKKKTLITGVGIIATSVALSTVVGFGISIPLTIGGFCCYKIANYKK